MCGFIVESLKSQALPQLPAAPQLSVSLCRMHNAKKHREPQSTLHQQQHTIIKRCLVSFALERSERSLHSTLERLLHCNILGLKLAGAVGWNEQDEDVRVAFQKSAERFADVN